jgi:DHA1 family bicyclomycin/chloramphenicol resistance-like MFS transporter
VIKDQHSDAPLWLLALLTFCGTLAMHIFVPALPSAARDLGTRTDTIQMTVSLYILGLAFGQLIYGPLSDRLGRRPVLMAGIALYTVAGFAAAAAPNVDILIAARLFQAFGGCAGLVLGRAIIRDTAAAPEAAKRLALMSLMTLIGPGFSPFIGGVLASTSGWRSIFLCLGVFGAASFVLAALLLRETATIRRGESVRRHYKQLVLSPAFLGYAIGGACATTSMYAFIAAAPFIFTAQLHLPAHEVGMCIGLFISGTWVGTIAASKLIGRIEINRLLIGANLISVIAALGLLGVVLTHQLSVPLAVGIMFIFTFGVGIVSPISLTRALGVHPQIIGSASGLYGFAQMAVGALCAAIAGFGSDPALVVGIVLATAGILSQGAFWVARRY